MAKILVVDDELMMLSLLRTILIRLGHEVFMASGGTEAIEKFRTDRPQITILDLNLPDLNGIEVLQQIRGADPKAPVIILTGAGTDAMEQQARALGVTDFLQKGFSLHGLGEALRRVTKQQNQPAAPPSSA
ncbi:MAG: response regulator [Nitrospirae bacterium]|nr:MAG: response regulator [Nitrospirota bacterium]